LELDDIDRPDRAPAVPFVGFVSGTVISFALWVVLSLAAFIVFQ
jgi:hypothetical protein